MGRLFEVMGQRFFFEVVCYIFNHKYIYYIFEYIIKKHVEKLKMQHFFSIKFGLRVITGDVRNKNMRVFL